jgi:hypothetical protein
MIDKFCSWDFIRSHRQQPDASIFQGRPVVSRSRLGFFVRAKAGSQCTALGKDHFATSPL